MMLSWLSKKSGDQSQQEAVAQASATAKRLAVVRAPEFIEWFGKSQLVDEHGEPMVFYHGTNNGGFTVNGQ